ncbi:MAG: hypothetical protein GF398_00615 [Chitinivibrionales bacterium]|nr:hypothetical protein [Chitinivibrionales bacterium]
MLDKMTVSSALTVSLCVFAAAQDSSAIHNTVPESPIAAVEHFLKLLKRNQYEQARAMQVPDDRGVFSPQAYQQRIVKLTGMSDFASVKAFSPAMHAYLLDNVTATIESDSLYNSDDVIHVILHVPNVVPFRFRLEKLLRNSDIASLQGDAREEAIAAILRKEFSSESLSCDTLYFSWLVMQGGDGYYINSDLSHADKAEKLKYRINRYTYKREPRYRSDAVDALKEAGKLWPYNRRFQQLYDEIITVAR